MSSGGVSPAQQIPLVPGYQVPFAQAIKEATGVNTMAVGLITEPQQAEDIVASGKADCVAIAARHALRPALALARRGPARRDRECACRNTGARCRRRKVRCSAIFRSGRVEIRTRFSLSDYNCRK